MLLLLLEYKILPESVGATDSRSLTREGLLTETAWILPTNHRGSWYYYMLVLSVVSNQRLQQLYQKCFKSAAPYKSEVKIVLSLRMGSDVRIPTIGSHENLQLSESQPPLTQNVDKFQI